MNTKQVLTLLCFLLSALASHADEAFRLHRYDTFKVQPINEQSIVFVGNSITNMHPWVEAFGCDPRVVNRGNSGGTSAEILANARSYCAGHPAKIFLMIGINDKPSSSNQATIVSNIEQTIQIIQAESPATKIYVQSILPSGWFSTPTDIANCNTAIQTMLEGYPKVQYLDVYSLLLGKLNTDNTGVYSFDKLHTTAAGYTIWTNFIKDYVGLTPVYPSESETKARQLNGGNSGSFGARATYFSMMPIASDDVLFFGDEMVHGAEWQELLRNPSVKNRGTNWGYEGTTAGMPNTSNDIDVTFASVSGVTKQEPKQVLLYTGTGEINAGTAVSTVLSSYKALVTKIRGYAPNAKISLVSLMPTHTYNNNARVKEFNAALQNYAASAANVEYIDIYSTLTTNDVAKAEYFPVSGNDYIYGDGYVAIANVLARYIDNCNPVTPAEAAAYRNLIKGVTVEPTPVATLRNKAASGSPYILTEEEAAPFLSCSGKATVAIDYTLPSDCSGMLALVGASNSNATNHTFSIVARDNGATGVRFYGLNNGLEGWYTSANVGLNSGSHKVVIVIDPEVGYKYYADGTYLRDVKISDLGAYGLAHFGNVSANTVSLGGLVTSSGTTLGGSVTINSLRLYDTALTAEQIASLSYDFDDEEDPSGIISYTIDQSNGTLTGSNPNSSWRNNWVSTQAPQLVLNCGANNMAYDGDGFRWETGTASSSNYVLTAPDGYFIKDVQFAAKAMTATTVSITFDGQNYTTSSSGQTFTATDVNRATFSIVLAGTNSVNTHVNNFVVTIIPKALVPVDPNAEPDAFTIFATPSSGGVPYRIPAVATAQNGNLITVADYRTSRADIGSGEIDLHIRLSKDNGATWETIMRPSVMDGDGNISTSGYQYGAFGDPCIVADRKSGRVMIMSCSGYPGYFNGTRSQHQGLARWYSDDNGETWTQSPAFLDETYIYSRLDASNYGPITGMFVGSGKIHQSRYVKVRDYYRLYCSFSCHKAGVTSSTNFVLYSDDFGETWDFLGGINGPAVPSGGDEPKVEELPNGNILFSGRRYGAGGRNFNIFEFTDREKAEGRWLGVAVSNSNNGGILGDNATNGEILLVPVVRKSDGEKMYLALQSMPWGPNRYNVGIQYKALDASTDYDTPAHFAQNWEGSHQVSYTSSCYSTMSVQADHTIAFVYEENSKNSGYDIQYKRYTIECITDGQYSFDADYVPTLPETPVVPEEPDVTELPLGDVVTSLSQIDDHKTYALYNPHFTAYARYAPEYSTSAVWTSGMIGDSGHAVADVSYTLPCSFADPNTAWMVVTYKGNTYLYNVGAQKFVTVNRPTTLGGAAPITVSQLSGGFAFNTSGGSQTYMCAGPQLTEPIAVWTSSDDGSLWQLIENPNIEEDYERCISLIDPSYVIRGDADNNKRVERSDVGTLVDYLLVRRTNPPTTCDVNEDTRISIADLARLIERLLNKR